VRLPWPAGLGVAGLVAMAALAGCRPGSGPVDWAAPAPPPPPVVYAAIGASETAGAGTGDPVRESFPQLLFRRLDRSAVLYAFGLPGETTEAALRDELPSALAVRPTLATVWLNVDDLAAGVPVADYEQRLDRLVAALRHAGVGRVLLANTPHLDRLPAYRACRSEDLSRCPLGALASLPPEGVEALVGGYNEAIARVAEREGATLVDLHAAGEVPDLHPDYVGRDGLHPSAAGAADIAATFARALAEPAAGVRGGPPATWRDPVDRHPS
jgi:lysophospholipase L1-like esterase